VAEVPLEEVAGAVLIEAAREAARNAYAPYSGFPVGAAVLLANGDTMAGANFENASFGLSLCAETVALASASAAGRLGEVVALAVSGGAAPLRPCGRCRQVLAEAARYASRDIVIYCAASEGQEMERHLISELLPHAFGAGDLAP
jgi:cytidine deaminase